MRGGVRIEDTDKERSKPEYEKNIIESLRWLGLEYDNFYRQSDRTDIYVKYIKQLLDSNNAFISKEAREEGGKESEVVRFRNPNGKVRFDDLIRGPIEFDTTELGDFIIARSLTEPVFHLAVVVDDAEAEITHIVRGEDHISNTPRHILLYEALGLPVPKYAHIPLLLAADRSKLSKRKGALPITAYRDRGYLREAVVNYLALLGWHPSDERELLTKHEILKEFSLDRVQKSGAIFDDDKLKWFNRQYILKLSDTQFMERAKQFLPQSIADSGVLVRKLQPLLKDKIRVFGEATSLFEKDGELEFLNNAPKYSAEILLWKKDQNKESTKNRLMKVRELLAEIPTAGTTDFEATFIKSVIWPYAETQGKGEVLWPLRVALTGKEKSPEPFIVASLLGRDESLRRIDGAISLLAQP